jgi:hypothetical protein
MAETHVISALRAKRAEVSGYIHDLEKKVKRIRVNMAHIDATIRIFATDLNPDSILPKRRCVDTLRVAAGVTIAATKIAKAAMADKGISVDDPAQVASVIEMVFTSLRGLCKRDAVIKTGTSRDAKWALAGPIYSKRTGVIVWRLPVVGQRGVKSQVLF